MGFYHDKQEYDELNLRLARDMRAFKQKVVQVVANAQYDPDTIGYPMEELDPDEFLKELMGDAEDVEEDDDENPMGIKWNIHPPQPKLATGGNININVTNPAGISNNEFLRRFLNTYGSGSSRSI